MGLTEISRVTLTAMKYVVVIKSSSGPVLAHNECDIVTMVTFEYLIRRFYRKIS